MRTITLDGRALFEKSEWEPMVIDAFKRQLTYENPEYTKMLRINQNVARYTPKYIYGYKETDKFFAIPRGYFYQLCKGALGAFEICLVDKRVKTDKLSFSKNIKLYSHQQEAVDGLLSNPNGNGVICSPPGSGKTVMGLNLIAEKGQKTLVLVHTIDLLDQWQERIKEFLPGTEVGVIGNGKWVEKDLTIATIQTLYPYFKDEDKKEEAEEFRQKWGMVILDEAHRCPATSFTKVVQRFPAFYRFGLTATPERSDHLEQILFNICGDVMSVVDYDKLVDAGKIVKPIVRPISTDFWFDYCSPNDWQPLLRGLTGDIERNEKIVSYIEQEKNNSCLVLSNRIEHLEELHKRLLKRMSGDTVRILTSKAKAKERKQVLQDLRDKKVNIVFATQLADEGLDVINLDRIFLTFPNKFGGKIKQQIGRILRTADGKDGAIIYDFADMKIPVLMNQYRNRVKKVYNELGLEIQIQKGGV